MIKPLAISVALTSVLLAGCAGHPQRTKVEIIEIARDTVREVAPWADSAEYSATLGTGVFGWFVVASCTVCKDSQGNPKSEAIVISIDRWGKVQP